MYQEYLLILTVTASGSFDIPADLSDYDSLRTQLNVTAVSGVSPTLDVKIQDSITGEVFGDLVVFAQNTATGSETKGFTGAFGRKLKVVYTVTGTSPSFTFSLGVAAKG